MCGSNLVRFLSASSCSFELRAVDEYSRLLSAVAAAAPVFYGGAPACSINAQRPPFAHEHAVIAVEIKHVALGG